MKNIVSVKLSIFNAQEKNNYRYYTKKKFKKLHNLKYQ